jgi:hypothetical protein
MLNLQLFETEFASYRNINTPEFTGTLIYDEEVNSYLEQPKDDVPTSGRQTLIQKKKTGLSGSSTLDLPDSETLL